MRTRSSWIGWLIFTAVIVCISSESIKSQAAENDAAVIKVVVWDEQQGRQKEAYPNFLGNFLADYLKRQPGISVRSVRMDDKQQGLSPDVLDGCDVLIWWGHRRHKEVSVEKSREIVQRICAGKLSLIALHSAHFSTPFMMAMDARAVADARQQLSEQQRRTAKLKFTGPLVRKAPKREAALTPSATFTKQDDGTTLITVTRANCCFPAWKSHGQPSQLKTLLPNHPIAKGIPKDFTIPETEMYDEPFHVPTPDAVIFEERWKDGQHFRSGSAWKLGKGKVFYFRPGHETFQVYFQPTALKIIENTVRWMGDSSF